MRGEPSETPAGGELQFDRLEDAGSGREAPTCAACGNPIAESYFEVNARVVCPRCRRDVEAHFNAGTSAGRFSKALVFGLAAAALGTAIYYGILALTGYEFGLVAIVVGLMVGAAVRKGSNGRGGWRYQGLAMFLTYTSIVSSYVPLIVQEVVKQQSAVADSATANPAGPTAPAMSTAAAERPSPGGAVLALLMALGLLYAIPFLAGFENVVGLIIIGIGLYEAWKLNKRAELKIAGPFRVGAAGSPSAPTP